MICPICRNAAKLAATHQINRSAPIELRDLVASDHGLCRGGTWCDCQHKIPYAVQLRALA